MQDRRFVVLLHEIGEGLERTDRTHVDWMFEVGESLLTWATPVVDRFDRPLDLVAEKLPNHRVAYLTYEGEVSGNRGTVTRVAAGCLNLIRDLDREFVAQLDFETGYRAISGRIFCQRQTEVGGEDAVDTRDCWRLRFSPGP